MNIRTEGAAKDANLRVVFIERLSINGPEGKPVGDGTNLLVYLIAPVKDIEGNAAQLVIGGITEDPADAPGPFGVYLPASIHTLQRTTTSGSGSVIETQDWSFAAATGEQFKMSITFERGVGNSRPARETRFYSASNPKFYQIYNDARMLEILRNVTTTPPDKVKKFSFTAGGGKYSDLFDGKEKILSWDNFMWQKSEVFVP